MITDARNKAMQQADAKTKTELQSYHFPGGGEYEPMTVSASSREEAEQKWRETRKKVEPSQTIES